MRVITHNQVALVDTFVSENDCMPIPTFKAGDSILALHDWALDALCALAITWKQTGCDDVALIMHEFKTLILLEVL